MQSLDRPPTDQAGTQTLPSLFLVGGPKCGTTSLSRYLGAHRDIYMCRPKEPHYFNSDFANRRTTSLSEYVGYFATPEARQACVAGEASTLYLSSLVAVPNVMRFNPRARFIAMVRNPIDMAYSLHSQRLWDGDETIDDFPAAWRAQTDRALGCGIPSSCRDAKMLLYGPMCRLGQQLQRLLSVVPVGQLFIVVFDDFIANPRRIYADVLSFLGLADDGRTDFPIFNPNRTARSRPIRRLIRHLTLLKQRLGISRGLGILRWVVRNNTVLRQRPALPEPFLSELAEYFRSDIQDLEAILQRPLAPTWFGGR